MKYRALTLLFITCISCGLALSESQTDAPLMPDGVATAPVVQKANCSNKRGHAKKVKASESESKNATSANGDRGPEQQSAAAYAAPQTAERKN